MNTVAPPRPATSSATISSLLFHDPAGDGSTATADAARACRAIGLAVELVDVWDDGERAVRHRVTTLPSLLLLSGGDEIARLAGRWTARRLNSFLERTLVTRPA